MSLITNIGASHANSYVTLDVARLILESIYNAVELSEWTALADAAKEYRLILAAQTISLLPLRGRRVYKDQALAFPRTLYVPRDEEVTTYTYGTHRVADSDRVLYGWTDDAWQDETACRRVPDEVKEAQCRIAFGVIHETINHGSGDVGQYLSTVGSLSIGGMNVSLKHNVNSGNIFDSMWRATQAFVFVKMQKWISQFRGGAIRSIYDIDYWKPCETLPTTTTTTTTTSSTTSSTSSTCSTTSTTSTA